jgi:hypothetical protein
MINKFLESIIAFFKIIYINLNIIYLIKGVIFLYCDQLILILKFVGIV